MNNLNEQLILRPMVLEDEIAFLQAYKAWDSSSGFLLAQRFEPQMKFSDYLDLLDANERGLHLQPGYVPATILSAFVGGNLVGRVSIRHELNDFLLKLGGHIGYGVVPEFRKRGLAKEMLAQALPVAFNLGINKVLVTCDDDNIGSIKTIEANGGVLENKVDAGPDKPLKRRYWIGR